MIVQCLATSILFFLLGNEIEAYPYGPPYPVTAALFQDRFSAELWDDALYEFAKAGGNQVWLEGPPLVRRTKSSLQQDPVFKQCKTSGSDPVQGPVDCFEQAEKDLRKDGINILSYASYQYEENFSDVIMRCPKYDRKMVTANYTYFRLVLPKESNSDPCNFTNNEAVVLFTSFAGKDPHALLLNSASKANFTVYFGFPKLSVKTNFDILYAYLELADRIIADHKARYSKVAEWQSNASQDKSHFAKTLYDLIMGYYCSDARNLGTMGFSNLNNTQYKFFYSSLAQITGKYPPKMLAVATDVDLNKLSLNHTIADHVNGIYHYGWSSVDVVVVREGRGMGKAAYYWPTQINMSIASVDPELDKILRTHFKSWKTNGTFADAFTGSLHELFNQLSNASKASDPHKIPGDIKELWLGIEAFENLQDEPCHLLPHVHRNPSEPISDRTSKSRIDRAITHAAARVNGAMAFSWDPDFTCQTKSHSAILADEIATDMGRPIIADCFLHSRDNRSVVIVGFNLLRETQGYMLDWPDRDGNRHSAEVFAYYVEADYGHDNNYIASMVYIQMWDAYNVFDLADKGYMIIKAESSYHECAFTYDYT